MITTYDYIDANKKKTVLLTLLFPISLLVLMFVVLYIALLLYPELRVNNNSIVTQIINNYGVFFLVCIIFSTLWTIIAFFEGSNTLRTAFALTFRRRREPNRGSPRPASYRSRRPLSRVGH